MQCWPWSSFKMQILQRSEQCPVACSDVFTCMICRLTKTLMFMSVVLINTLLSEKGQQKSNPFCEKDYNSYGKNVERSLPPSSDPLNFQYRKRVGKGTRSSGYRQKQVHPTGPSKPIPEIINFIWLSTTSWSWNLPIRCCLKARTQAQNRQSRIKSWSTWKQSPHKVVAHEVNEEC